MNEENLPDEALIFRYIITVDGDPHAKANNLDGAIYIVQQVRGTTDDPVEIHMIH